MNKVLLITHFNYTEAGPIHGPTHTIASFLQKRKIPYKMIAHPLYAGRLSYVETFNAKGVKNKVFGTSIKYPLLIKSLIEIYQNLRLAFGDKYSVVISIDPLNALSGILLKKMGFTKKSVFYTVDYATNRFPNFLPNYFYHLIDLFSIRLSDEVWNVSTRILNERKKQGISDAKNLYVPNSPSFASGVRLSSDKVDRFNIMMVTGITHSPIFSTVLSSIKKLLKKHPKVGLTIIGTGNYEDGLKREVREMDLDDKVRFLGQLDHTALMKTICRGGIGLAIYTEDFSWTRFGDSMKAREYLSCGLPVVISDVVSTSEDIRKYDAGFAIKPTPKDLFSALNKILKDRNLWLMKRENAVNLARAFDMEVLLGGLLLPLVEEV